MMRSPKFSVLFAAAGLCLLAGCAGVGHAPQSAIPPPNGDGLQLAGAWYQIFFATDESQINDRGQVVLQTVANLVKSDDLVRVTIVGRTDSVGSPQSNNLLSQHRADMVRDGLIALEVPANRIDTSWVGEREQDFATPQNVAKQRNRVVDIAVQHPYD